VLKARGHLAVAKEAAAALARELEDRLGDDLESVAGKLDPWRSGDVEVTTTFVDDGVDEQVEELVGGLARTLLTSENVEDVFAEEAVLRRELLRVLRDGLVGAQQRDAGAPEEGPVRVRLDGLGHVPAMVARRAPVRALRAALDRAAESVGCKLNAYDPESREATFSLSEATFSITVADPEARLDLEQAIVDELTDLVSANVVALPALERSAALGRSFEAAEISALRPQIEVAAARILRQGGSTGSWDLDGGGTLTVSLTPVSERDAVELDRRVAELVSEIQATLAAPAEVVQAVVEADPEEATEAADAAEEQAASRGAPSKRASGGAARKAAGKKAAGKKAAPAKKAASKKAAPAKKAAGKKAAGKKAAGKKAAPAKKAASKKAASKKAAPAKKTAGKKAASKKATGKAPARGAKKAAVRPAKKAAGKKSAKRR